MSNIEWTDTTWQVTSGCTKVSPGCASCYAETMANRLAAMARADEAVGRNPGKKKSYPLVVNDKGRWNGTVVPLPDNLTDPLHWKKPRMVFVNSMSDLFHESVRLDDPKGGDMAEWPEDLRVREFPENKAVQA